MTSETLTQQEKERLLKALEKDREFRYALMGLLGFREILDRITKLEERFEKLAERQQKLEERIAKLEERFVELEERQQRLEKRFAKLEERFAELEKRFIELEKRFIELAERQQKLEKRIAELNKTVAAIGHRFGIITEKAFREAMRYVVEEVLGAAKVERWVHRDEKGIVYGYSTVVEVDVVVRDREHVLVEVKSRVSRGDVAELHKIGRLYEEVRGVKPKLLIIGGFVDPAAYEAAAKLGVEIRPLLGEDAGV